MSFVWSWTSREDIEVIVFGWTVAVSPRNSLVIYEKASEHTDFRAAASREKDHRCVSWKSSRGFTIWDLWPKLFKKPSIRIWQCLVRTRFFLGPNTHVVGCRMDTSSLPTFPKLWPPFVRCPEVVLTWHRSFCALLKPEGKKSKIGVGWCGILISWESHVFFSVFLCFVWWHPHIEPTKI